MSEGASYSEQLIDACRRNNDELIKEIFAEIENPDKISALINDTKDALGNSPLHIAVKFGYYNVLDLLLYSDAVEIDPKNNLDGDTPLHLAVKYSHSDLDYGKFLAEILIDCGADPRIKNKDGDTPKDLVMLDQETEEEKQMVQEFIELLDEGVEARIKEEEEKKDPQSTEEGELSERLQKLNLAAQEQQLAAEASDGEATPSESDED